MIEKLKERLQDLVKQKQQAQNAFNQAVADIHAIEGAIQEVTYWLKEVSDEDDSKEGN